ncbi:UbiX family flavin prenyltransferase [Desulfoluna butyratoxydans]|uniref:Flavin prenyltransferase UbiX n=1 Tax=Desulfoluna butyratoxydans TaxID=231438 RepID=A0A4U8YLP4_9BACT|nr:UbiX family flavin prenyltransferase [Desulfoluna butyratoxydans]VFQ44069.1 flavin prenyltransferase ubix/pad1 [Desulfoluna butyratoxydans]
MKRIVTALTGASGALYGLRLVKALAEAGAHIDLIASDAAFIVAEEELGLPKEAFLESLRGFGPDSIEIHAVNDFTAAPASGSCPVHAMVVAPCTMATLAAIATGNGHNLIHRAADVTLKEKRPLVLVPREMPYSLIHLNNMTAAATAGATILPASPAFYSRPDTLEALADTVVARILDHVGITPAKDLVKRWKS